MLDKIVIILTCVLFLSCTNNARIHESVVQETGVIKYNERFTLERYKQYYTEFVRFDKLYEYDSLCKKDCRKLNNRLNLFIYDMNFSISSSIYLYDKNDYRLYFMIKLY